MMRPEAYRSTATHLSRRDFLNLSTASAAAILAGCATNPVTGRRQLMFVSRAQEIAQDRKWSPHQFSADYGSIPHERLNAYVSEVGLKLSGVSHRPDMPYSFRVVNSVIANAYTFPGGSAAVTRGLMVEFRDESELAAVLGHEIGHVNARHNAERMTKTILAMGAVAAITAYVQHEKEEYAGLTAGLGGLGAGLLLARYSRNDEREADALGMEYMTKAGYTPSGMADVMDILRKLNDRKPSIVDLMFATHPMSEERYQTALERIRTTYTHAAGFRTNRERYMDETAELRKIAPAIANFQNGQKAIMEQRYGEAETEIEQGLAQAPHDYTGLLLMAKSLMARKKYSEAVTYAAAAHAAYPQEPQARHVRGMSLLEDSRFEDALRDFREYERLLPGNSNTIFYEGFCLEKMQNRQQAASEYLRYLDAAPSGEYADYARTRLTEWGYMQPPAEVPAGT